MVISQIRSLYRDENDLFRTVTKRHGWLIPPEWAFQSEVWEYERESVDGDRGEDSGTF